MSVWNFHKLLQNYITYRKDDQWINNIKSHFVQEVRKLTWKSEAHGRQESGNWRCLMLVSIFQWPHPWDIRPQHSFLFKYAALKLASVVFHRRHVMKMPCNMLLWSGGKYEMCLPSKLSLDCLSNGKKKLVSRLASGKQKVCLRNGPQILFAWKNFRHISHGLVFYVRAWLSFVCMYARVIILFKRVINITLQSSSDNIGSIIRR